MSGSTGTRAHSSMMYLPTTPAWSVVSAGTITMRRRLRYTRLGRQYGIGQVRLGGVDRDEREVALELRIDAHQGLHKIAVVLTLEHVHDDFGVGLGCEAVTIRNQVVAQLAVVLDDPVEHNRELACV